MKVKICGITNSEDARLASIYGADILGFVFAKKSPRCLKKETAKKIVAGLDPLILKAGVFVDEQRENVIDIAKAARLDILQFHGNESSAYCKSFRQDYRVIKTIFDTGVSFSSLVVKYSVDAFLVDIAYEDKQKGRTMLSQPALKEISGLIKKGVSIIISSGLDDKNVTSVTKFKPYGVDAASGIEKFIGKKDEKKMQAFIRRAKGY